MKHPVNALVVRKVGETLKDSVYEQLLEAIELLGVGAYWERRVSPLSLRYKPTGTRIIFRGADKPEKIKSIKSSKHPIAVLWIEELAEFKTEDEAVQMANDTEFGLAAYFYTRDVGRTWRVSEGLEYGIVGVNTGLISTETAPFGGMKASGIGREGSRHGIEEYLEVKYLCLGGIDG